MRGKLDQIRVSAVAFSTEYDVIILAETRLNDGVYDSEIELGSFIIFRDDRSSSVGGSRGGGVLIVVKKSIRGMTFDTLDTSLLSSNQLFVILPDPKTIIGAIYIPPASNISLYQDHVMHVEDIMNIFFNYNLILIGDYNLPEVTWSLTANGALHVFEKETSALTRLCAPVLVNSFTYLNLSQFNCITNSKDNILDLCFSNCFCAISLSKDILSNIDEFHPILNVSTLPSNNAYIESSFSPLNFDWIRYDFMQF